MKLGETVSIGGFSSKRFDSSEHATARECAEDLLVQMRPFAAKYPTIAAKIEELKQAYGVS